MSFYINYNNANRPGPINANGLNTICEKLLIEANKVFDACISQDTVTGAQLALTNFTPASPTLPLTFVSARNDPSLPVTISNIVIDRIECKPNFANVSATITIPVIVSYLDANNVPGTATSTITVNKSAVLFVPQSSLSPIEIKAFAVISSTSGTIADSTATITYCIQVVLKVVSLVDILVPSFGYPILPMCQEAEGAGECPGFFDTPIYPTATR